MDKPSGKNPSDEDHRAAELEEWLLSFVPSETAIDGGLFPARLGKGMVGLEDYSKFELAGRPADYPELDDATRQTLRKLFERSQKAKKK